jgi:hypothetical protein
LQYLVSGKWLEGSAGVHAEANAENAPEQHSCLADWVESHDRLPY